MLQFIGIVVSMFSVMSMQLILVSVMPAISLELGGASLYSWVFSGYMIASLVTIPLFSKLADVYGRRRFYLISICVFITGSVLGALASTMGQLIFARLIQGAAAGILTPVTMAMISELFPPVERGKMIGYFSLVQLASNVLSPMLGEVITEQLNWHWVFYLSIALLAIALLISLAAGSKQTVQTDSVNRRKIDVLGSLLFGALSALIVYFFNGFENGVSWNAPFILCAALIIVAAIGLVFVEKRAKNPVIRTDFFRTKVLRRAIISALFSGAVMYGFINLLPILTGLVTEKVPVGTGTTLLAFMVGITAGMLLGSRLWAKFARLSLVLWVIMAVTVLGVMLCLRYELYWLLIASNIVSGIALGGIMSTVMIYSQNSVSDADRTVLSGLVQLCRYFGAAIGVAIMISLIPNVTAVGSPSEFIAAFGVVLCVCSLGILNEWV